MQRSPLNLRHRIGKMEFCPGLNFLPFQYRKERVIYWIVFTPCVQQRPSSSLVKMRKVAPRAGVHSELSPQCLKESPVTSVSTLSSFMLSTTVGEPRMSKGPKYQTWVRWSFLLFKMWTSQATSRPHSSFRSLSWGRYNFQLSINFTILASLECFYVRAILRWGSGWVEA